MGNGIFVVGIMLLAFGIYNIFKDETKFGAICGAIGLALAIYGSDLREQEKIEESQEDSLYPAFEATDPYVNHGEYIEFGGNDINSNRTTCTANGCNCKTKRSWLDRNNYGHLDCPNCGDPSSWHHD